MKMIKELRTLREQAEPKFLLIYTDESDTYDLIREIMEKLGWKEQASAADMISEQEYDEYALATAIDDYEDLEQVGVWAKTMPAKAAVLAALEQGELIIDRR